MYEYFPSQTGYIITNIEWKKVKATLLCVIFYKFFMKLSQQSVWSWEEQKLMREFNKYVLIQVMGNSV